MTSLSPSDTDGGYLNETVPPVRTSTGPCRVQQNPPYKPSDMFVLQGLPRPPLRKSDPRHGPEGQDREGPDGGTFQPLFDKGPTAQRVSQVFTGVSVP